RTVAAVRPREAAARDPRVACRRVARGARRNARGVAGDAGLGRARLAPRRNAARLESGLGRGRPAARRLDRAAVRYRAAGGNRVPRLAMAAARLADGAALARAPGMGGGAAAVAGRVRAAAPASAHRGRDGVAGAGWRGVRTVPDRDRARPAVCRDPQPVLRGGRACTWQCAHATVRTARAAAHAGPARSLDPGRRHVVVVATLAWETTTCVLRTR